MFQDKGLRGMTLNAVLHHQHRRIYVFDSTCVPCPHCLDDDADS